MSDLLSNARGNEYTSIGKPAEAKLNEANRSNARRRIGQDLPCPEGPVQENQIPVSFGIFILSYWPKMMQAGICFRIFLYLIRGMKVLGIKDFEEVSSFFKGKRGHRRAEFVMRFLAIDQVNRVYDNSGAYSGLEFTSRLLEDLGVHYVIGHAERLRSLPEGSFITVSNHPYGGLDGIISIDLMASVRPDYKFMVNEILSLIKTLDGNFISVTPADNKNSDLTSTNIGGIRETLEYLRGGHPVGFFPSGAVSDFSLRHLRIRDRPWQEGILKLIHSAKVPILPIRFFDRNSTFFYFLGLINWRIRMLRLSSEVFNKKDQVLRVGIGNIISVKEQERFDSPESLGVFLRKAVYEMPLPASFISRKSIHHSAYQKRVTMDEEKTIQNP